MGDRWRPKSSEEVRDPERAESGDSTLAEYGRGHFDEESGLFEWYEVPPEIASRGLELTLADVVEQWPLVIFDFATILHVDLEQSMRRPFRWFKVRLSGLLDHEDSKLRTYFASREGLDG